MQLLLEGSYNVAYEKVFTSSDLAQRLAKEKCSIFAQGAELERNKTCCEMKAIAAPNVCI